MFGFNSHGMRQLADIQRGPKRSKRKRLSKRFRQRIFWRDGGECQYCGVKVPFKDATMDHVTPLVKRGGNRAKENIVLACAGCNKTKGPLVMDDPGDLAPEILAVKFMRVTETTAKRKGRFREQM
jgi:5-methylcytosine-specific restriction endonuclease McrA